MTNSIDLSLDPVPADCYVWYNTTPMEVPVYHYHNGYELYFLLKGSAHFSVEESRFDVEQGSILLIQPWEKHRIESYGSECYERYAVHVSYDIIERLSTPKTNLMSGLFNRPFGKPRILSVESEELDRLVEILQELYRVYCGSGFGKDVLCDAYIAQLCVYINELLLKNGTIELQNTMPELVSKTMSYINAHLQENISLDDLSKELYHNGVYISRCFKNVTGLSIKEYILRKRISQTQVYLAKGCSVAESGQKMGFYDASNFTRTFTKYVGITPKEYQKTTRGSKIASTD